MACAQTYKQLLKVEATAKHYFSSKKPKSKRTSILGGKKKPQPKKTIEIMQGVCPCAEMSGREGEGVSRKMKGGMFVYVCVRACLCVSMCVCVCV